MYNREEAGIEFLKRIERGLGLVTEKYEQEYIDYYLSNKMFFRLYQFDLMKKEFDEPKQPEAD